MEAKIDKIKLIQCFNCQKWGNHISKNCYFEPVCAICGFDHPSKRIKMIIFVNTPMTNLPAFHEGCEVFKEVYARVASSFNR